MAKAAKAAGSSARFRQRKISVKQTLAVLKQSDIPDLEEEQQRELQQIETGVEKGEEEEHHLQAAINSSIAQSTGAKVEKIYIPTPDASQVWKDYDHFYSSSFHEPASYIRTSVTVEETSGCLYNMDDEDAEFLKTCKPPISEDDFEEVMQRFEVTISEKQPFVSIDVSNLLSFEEMAHHIEEGIRQVQEDPTSPEYILAQLQSSLGITVNGTRGKNEGKAFLARFKKIGAVIYPHWRARKVERKGQSIVPHLKFEDHEKDDSDPYVCFRRRELRQVRKTRRTDVLSIERLRRMQAEMETAKQLVEMIATREFTRKAALKAEWDVFEDRCAIKSLKRELGIKGEEEDLVAQKKRKVEPKKEEKAEKASTPVRGAKGVTASASTQAAAAQAAQAAGSGSPSVSSTHVPPNVSIPPSKIPNMDLITIAQVVRDKDEAIAKAVREKLRLRADADRDWHNLTNSGYIPYCEYLNAEVSSSGEPPVPQYSSINEMAYFEKHNASHQYTTKSDFNKDLASMVGNKPFPDAQVYGAVVGDNGELRLSDATTSSSPVDRVIPRSSFMSMRKRMGRGGRVWMDRRGLQRDTVLKPSSLAKNSLDDIAESEADEIAMERLADRLKYDRETEPTRQMSSYDKDPSQLNGISSDTQSIRFGSMLLSKAYENYREVFQQRQQQLMMLQQQILQQQQQQQMRNRQQSHPPGDPGAGIGGGHGAGGGAGGSRNNSPAPGANGPQSKMHNGAPMGYNKQGMTPSQHQQYQAMQQQQQQQQRKMGVAPMNAASAAAAMAAQPRRASGSPDSQRFNGLPNGGAMANGVLSNGMGQRMMPGGDMKQKSELAKVDA